MEDLFLARILFIAVCRQLAFCCFFYH